VPATGWGVEGFGEFSGVTVQRRVHGRPVRENVTRGRCRACRRLGGARWAPRGVPMSALLLRSAGGDAGASSPRRQRPDSEKGSAAAG
jgi:hypothetical protein